MIGTRVTHRTITDAAVQNLQNSLQRSKMYAEQLTSGKRINRPSDDATGTISAMQQRTEKRALEQHMRNADDGMAWLNTADGALQAAIGALRTAYVKTVQGGNTQSNGPDANNALANEIEGLRDTIMAIGNTQYGGRPVFGGTLPSGLAFDATGNYIGGNGNVNRQISGDATVKVNTNGDQAFGNFYQVLTDAATALRAGDNAAVRATIDPIKDVQTTMATALADVGSRVARLEEVKSRGEDSKLNLQSRIANIESIDIAETVMNMQLQEVAHKAALGATAKAIQPSLLDFLR